VNEINPRSLASFQPAAIPPAVEELQLHQRSVR
jgi:hypothetical protein